jgi:hypothetical protein
MKKILETFTFTNAKELRDWLSHVQGEADLSTVYIYNRYPVEGRRTDTGAELGRTDAVLSWEEETLTDGSTVNNILIS